MKEIKAIIQPFMQEKVLTALGAVPGLPGVTMSEVIGWGKGLQEEGPETLQEPSKTFSKKIKLEIVVPDGLLKEVLDAIIQAAHTGQFGDGKIFVSQVKDVVKIRTGERGIGAI